MNLEFLPFSNAFLRNQTNRNSIKQLSFFHRQLKNISPDKSCLSLSTKIKMPSQQILPITHHPFPFPNPNPNPNSSNDMCCITVEHVDDDDDRILLPPPPSLSFEDEKVMRIKPLLPRSSSYSSTSTTTSTTKGKKFYQQRRRRIPSDDSLPSLFADGDRLRSSGRDVEHAAADTFLLTRFSLKLFRYLGYFTITLLPHNCFLTGFLIFSVGYRWIARFLALGCYALLLVPGFVQVGYKYFFSRQIRRGIVYGDKPRNRLDLYLPKNSDGPKPVIAFVTGGAWIIGYKAWGCLLGQQLSERDIIVACIDYRNFPRATMSDMIEDASHGISFVFNHIAEYGGDPNRIYLMGQSAGAHIAACTLVEQAIKEAGEGESTSWSVSQIQAYLGLSGGYNLLELSDYFHSRGLYRSIFLRIMEGEQSLRRFSPEVMVQDPNIKNAVSLLPPIILFHGTADYSIPSDSSKNFAETLQRLGVKAEAIMYEDRTHTDMFLQDPMRGDDKMFEDLLSIVHADDPAALAKDAAAPPRRRLVPECMLRLARRVSPF